MKEITLKALAKINLGLDVIGKREDGYHELRMVMQTIHLHDRLQIRRTSEPGIKIHTNLSFLPVNESNLVYQAASLLMTEFKITEGVEVNLSKRIPVSAGMAGGSTDAAAMLYGMNRLFELGLSRGELMERGLKLGADIPYCLMRGTALAEGIGEELTQLPPMVKGPVLIAKPAVSVPTKLVYQKLKLDKGMSHPDINSLVRAIQKKDFDGVCAHMGNVLETVTIPMYPVIEQIKEQMLNSGAAAAMMSGSGPTVFGLFRDEKSAVQAVNEMRSSNLARQVFLTGIYNNRRE